MIEIVVAVAVAVAVAEEEDLEGETIVTVEMIIVEILALILVTASVSESAKENASVIHVTSTNAILRTNFPLRTYTTALLSYARIDIFKNSAQNCTGRL